MNAFTLAQRVLSGLRHDRRTMALVLIAPLLILGLLYLILTGAGSTCTVAVGNGSQSFVKTLENSDKVDIAVTNLKGEDWKEPAADAPAATNTELRAAVTEEGALAAVNVGSDLSKIDIYLDGTSAADAAKVQAAIASALQEENQKAIKTRLSALPIQLPASAIGSPEVNTNYVYGQEDASIFDSYGAALVGLIVFFLVFLIAGINFLTERTSGTLERMLATPIKRWEIVAGYTLGFSLLALIQTVLVTLFVIYVIGMKVVGSIWLVLLINALTALCALTMGILISNLASSEFQMVQFIPIVVIPQIFLCGIFSLNPVWEAIGHVVPLYYTANALQGVIIRGSGISDIWLPILVLSGFSLVFISANIAVLRRRRAW